MINILVNILLGACIFAYAIWMLFRFINKSKEGKCAGCPTHASCSVPACNNAEGAPKDK